MNLEHREIGPRIENRGNGWNLWYMALEWEIFGCHWKIKIPVEMQHDKQLPLQFLQRSDYTAQVQCDIISHRFLLYLSYKHLARNTVICCFHHILNQTPK